MSVSDILPVPQSKNPLLATLLEQKGVELYLHTHLSENHFGPAVLANPGMGLGMTGTERRDLLEDAMVSGNSVHVPRELSDYLARNAYDLDKAVTEWRPTMSTLLAPKGFCWFENPIPIHNSSPTGIAELTALIWNVFHIKDPDLAAEIAPAGCVQITGLVRASRQLFSQPALEADWALNTTYAESTDYPCMMFGPGSDPLNGASQGITLMRLFARLCQAAQNGAWHMGQFFIHDSDWPELAEVLASDAFTAYQRELAVQHYRTLCRSSREVLSFTRQSAVTD